MDYATRYIGKKVEVEMDRELGSKHPRHDFVYEVNYGYVPDTRAPDGGEVDVYVLGIDKPIKKFSGTCIAVIHRTDDDDDKLIVVPEDFKISDREIKKQTYFQEKWFTSIIIRK